MTYVRRKRHQWKRSKGARWATDECEANYSCPNPKVPGSNLCEYHTAIDRARAGDEEAIRVCRERYSLEFVEVAR